MPTTFVIPDNGVHIYASPTERKQISPGAGEISVVLGDADPVALKQAIVVAQAVNVIGPGAGISVTETEAKANFPKKPRKPRPSEKKRKG